MSVRRFLFLSCMAVTMTSGQGWAQSLRNLPVPAEFPPDSYTGTQYVDSAGCVFIRAGVGASETWVPRLTRSRQPLCGFAPSLAGATPDPVPEAAQQTQRTATAEPAPEADTTPRRAKAPAAAQPAATPRAATSRPATEPPREVIVIALPGSATRPATEAKAAAGSGITPKARPARTITPPDPDRTACAGLSGVSAAYTVQHNGSPVRCGPQQAHYITYARGSGPRAAVDPSPGAPATPETVPPGTRVAPARIYAKQKTSMAGISVPEGMEPVWEDDRLNPRRAHQTFEGKAQMEMVWTNTVPRRLIERRAGLTVATRGSHEPGPAASTTRREVQAEAPRASVSTRSAPATASAASAPVPEPARQTTHYAQAGLFADAAQGLAAARRIAGAGLPARRGTVERDGRALTLVLAGPFSSEAEARTGAARLRGMGFDNVRLR